MAKRKNKKHNAFGRDQDALIGRYDALDNEITTIRDENRPVIREWLTKLIGVELEIMLQSPEQTVTLLSHANADFRQAGLYLLDTHWGLAKKHVQEIEHMAMSDPARQVRELAIDIFGSAYARTQDVRVAQLLASVAINESLEESDRVAAFRSLVLVYGLSNAMDDGVQYPFAQCLGDVDWHFVSRVRLG